MTIIAVLLAVAVLLLAGTIRLIWGAYVSVSRRCLELMDEARRLEDNDG